MIVPASIAVPAVPPLIILANSKPVRVLQEQIYNLLIVAHLREFLLRYRSQSTPFPHFGHSHIFLELSLSICKRIHLYYVIYIVRLRIIGNLLLLLLWYKALRNISVVVPEERVRGET